MKKLQALFKAGSAAAVVTVVTSSQAFADATAAAAQITGKETDVETIGYAALGLLITAAVFKYMRRAT